MSNYVSHIDLVKIILEMRQAGFSWQKITDTVAPEVSKIVIWKIANTNYEPRNPILRHKLGLPRVASVQPVNGKVPPGTQVIGSSQCITCARPYISNHPRRRKCFICSPFRGRKP